MPRLILNAWGMAYTVIDITRNSTDASSTLDTLET